MASPAAKARARHRAALANRQAQKTGFYTGSLTQTKPNGFQCRKSRRPGSDKGQHAPDGGGWNNSPYIRDAVMTDSRWSKTASEHTSVDR